ncbi:hypothetical protein B0T13DRAFT_447345 [Neurospora crassa]|nr:hypothetical protein B0T13DRAFT_447345 [Neurospora crassa]
MVAGSPSCPHGRVARARRSMPCSADEAGKCGIGQARLAVEAGLQNLSPNEASVLWETTDREVGILGQHHIPGFRLGPTTNQSWVFRPEKTVSGNKPGLELDWLELVVGLVTCLHRDTCTTSWWLLGWWCCRQLFGRATLAVLQGRGSWENVGIDNVSLSVSNVHRDSSGFRVGLELENEIHIIASGRGGRHQYLENLCVFMRESHHSDGKKALICPVVAIVALGEQKQNSMLVRPCVKTWRKWTLEIFHETSFSGFSDDSEFEMNGAESSAGTVRLIASSIVLSLLSRDEVTAAKLTHLGGEWLKLNTQFATATARVRYRHARNGISPATIRMKSRGSWPAVLRPTAMPCDSEQAIVVFILIVLASALSISFAKAKQKAGGYLMVFNVCNAISRFIGGLIKEPITWRIVVIAMPTAGTNHGSGLEGQEVAVVSGVSDSPKTRPNGLREWCESAKHMIPDQLLLGLTISQGTNSNVFN